jgi:exodeoxyribonuclease VII small subunit
MKKEQSYKEIELELQEVLSRVEHDSYEELDDLLKDYDKGMNLIAQLQEKLEKAKNSIKKVSTKQKD